MKQRENVNLGVSDKSENQIKKREKNLEISIYVLLIIVTIAFMLIFFNLF